MSLQVAFCFNFESSEDAVHPCAWLSMGFGGESQLKLLRYVGYAPTYPHPEMVHFRISKG